MDDRLFTYACLVVACTGRNDRSESSAVEFSECLLVGLILCVRLIFAFGNREDNIKSVALKFLKSHRSMSSGSIGITVSNKCATLNEFIEIELILIAELVTYHLTYSRVVDSG